MLRIQRERYRSDCEFPPGLSLLGQFQGKFAYWLVRDFRENAGNKDGNALTVHRRDGMGRQGWKVGKSQCGPAASGHTLQPSLDPSRPHACPSLSLN